MSSNTDLNKQARFMNRIDNLQIISLTNLFQNYKQGSSAFCHYNIFKATSRLSAIVMNFSNLVDGLESYICFAFVLYFPSAIIGTRIFQIALLRGRGKSFVGEHFFIG